jgi:hypothetical protein
VSQRFEPVAGGRTAIDYNGEPGVLEKLLDKLNANDGLAFLLTTSKGFPHAIEFIPKHPDRFVGSADSTVTQLSIQIRIIAGIWTRHELRWHPGCKPPAQRSMHREQSREGLNAGKASSRSGELFPVCKNRQEPMCLGNSGMCRAS